MFEISRKSVLLENQVFLVPVQVNKIRLTAVDPFKWYTWPLLTLILGAPSQAPKILTDLSCLDHLYQATKSGNAYKPLIGVFLVKRMILYAIVYVKKILSLK